MTNQEMETIALKNLIHRFEIWLAAPANFKTQVRQDFYETLKTYNNVRRYVGKYPIQPSQIYGKDGVFYIICK